MLHRLTFAGRRFADLLLFCITATEFVLLFILTPTFTAGLERSGDARPLQTHPIYLSYVIADIGYNLQEWNSVTIALVLLGWASLVYRIKAEERLLSHHSGWQTYTASVRSGLLPGVW